MTNKTTARLVGALILLATATYITGSELLESILTMPDYLSQLYPNRVQVIVGALLEFVDTALELFGVPVGLMLSIPGGIFELILPIWLIVKGFNSEAFTFGSVKIEQQDSLSLSNA